GDIRLVLGRLKLVERHEPRPPTLFDIGEKPFRGTHETEAALAETQEAVRSIFPFSGLLFCLPPSSLDLVPMAVGQSGSLAADRALLSGLGRLREGAEEPRGRVAFSTFERRLGIAVALRHPGPGDL